MNLTFTTGGPQALGTSLMVFPCIENVVACHVVLQRAMLLRARVMGVSLVASAGCSRSEVD